MTGDQFRDLTLLISAYWPHWKANRTTLAAGQRLLSDLDFSAATAALDALAVEEPNFAPGLGRVRARAVELMGPAVPDEDEAWWEVQENIRRVGSNAYVFGTELTWSSPAVAEAVKAFGWQELCESQNEVADRAHFLRMYAKVVTRLRRDAMLPPAARELVADLAEHLTLERGE